MRALLTTTRTTVLLGSLALAVSGCVSKGKYDELQSDNMRLQTENEYLYIKNQELFGLAVGLNEEVALLDEELAMLEAEMAEIEADLDDLVLAGTIQMRMMKSGLRLILDDDVLFASGSAELSAEGTAAIAQVSDELKDVPYQIVVVGNTDNVPIGPNTAGRYPSNWALAAARAAAVTRKMADGGIPKQQLVAVSFGDTQPIASNDTPEGRSENRRIEIRLRPVVPQTEE